MSKIIPFPAVFDSSTAVGIARALLDFIKDKPNAKLLIVLKDDEGDQMNVGWNHMPSADMLFMIEFAKYKWAEQTFSATDENANDS